eukprot:m.16813 g.16813  ORF g.16813 m.16813 type:complete len:1474 (-) comp5338_c0_seq1:166-4587(-)
MINGAPRFAAGSGGDTAGAAMGLSGTGSNTPPPSPIKKRLRIESEAHARAARAESRFAVVGAGTAEAATTTTTSTEYCNTPAMGRARTAAMSKDTSAKLLKKRRRVDTDGVGSSFATPKPAAQRQKQQPRRRTARRSASPSTAAAGTKVTIATTSPTAVVTTTPADDGGRPASSPWKITGGIVLGSRLVTRFGQTEAATATAATATATPSAQEPEAPQNEALLSLSVHGPAGSVLRVDSCQLCPPSPYQFVCAHARQALRHLVASPTSFQFVSDPCLALATQAAAPPMPTSWSGAKAPGSATPMASLWRALQANVPEVVARFYNGAKALCAAFASPDAPVVATTAGASDFSVSLACSQCGPACCVHTVRALEPADDVIDTTLLRARLALVSRATLKSICVNLCWLTSALPNLDPLRHILTHFNIQQHPIKSISADVIRARALPKEHDIGCAMAPQQTKLALMNGAVIAEVVDTVVRFSPTTFEAACSECGPASGLDICLWCRHVVAAASAFSRAHSKRAVFNAEAIKTGLEAWETLNLVNTVVDVALISGTHQELIGTLDQLERCSSPSQTSAPSPNTLITTTTTTTTKRRRTEQHTPEDQPKKAAAPEILLDLVQVAQRRVSASTTALCSPSEEATKAQVVAWLHRRHTARQAAQKAYDTQLAAVRAVLTADQCHCVCTCDIDDGEACTSDCFVKCNCASRLVPAPSVQELDTNVLQQVVALLQQAQGLVTAEQVHVALPIVYGIIAATEFTGVFPALDEVVAKACEALVRLPQLDASQCQELAQRLDQRVAARGMGKAALVAWLAAVGGLPASDLDQAARGVFMAVIAPKPTAASNVASSSDDHSNSSPACSASHLAALAVHAARTQRLPLCVALCWSVLARRVECEGPFSAELQSALASSLVACAPLPTKPAAGSGSSEATGPVEDLVKADMARGACAASLSVYTSVVNDVTAVCTVPAALQVLGAGLLKAPGHADLGRACVVRAATLRAASPTPSAAAVADTLSQLVSNTAPKLLAEVARPVLARLSDKGNDASGSSAACSIAQAVSQQRSPSAALVFLNALGQQPPVSSALWQQWVRTCIAADAGLEDVIPLIDAVACVSATNTTATTATTTNTAATTSLTTSNANATAVLMTACVAELVVGLGPRRRDTAKAVVAHCLSLQAKLSAESKLLLLQTLAACEAKPESSAAATVAASPDGGSDWREWLDELVMRHARSLVDALPALSDKLRLIALVLDHSAELATSLAVQCVRAEQDGSRPAAMGHAVNLLASATCRLRSSQPASPAAAQLCQDAKNLMTSRLQANDLWTVASVCLQLGDHQLALDITVALVAALSKDASKTPSNTTPRSVVVNLVSTVIKAQQAGRKTQTALAMDPELLASGLSAAERQALAKSLEGTHPQLASRLAVTTPETQAGAATIAQLKQRDLTPPPTPSFVSVNDSPTSPIKTPTFSPKRRRSHPPRTLDSRR